MPRLSLSTARTSSLLEHQLGREHPRSALARIDIGDELYDRGDRVGALVLYRESADILVTRVRREQP